MRINQTFSRIVGAIWDIFFEIVAICFLVLVLVVAFATCLTVSMSRSDPLFASFGTSGEHFVLGRMLCVFKNAGCICCIHADFLHALNR